MQSRNRFRYVPLLAAGVLVFLGIVFLGDLTGLLWHSYTFGWWVPLHPSILSQTGDWLVWGGSFLLSVLPFALALIRRRIRPDPVVVLTSLVLPLLSLLVVSWSYYIGATLLVASGFLAAYTLASRSVSILSMPRGTALRLIATEVFAFLAVTAAGGIVSILVYQGGALVSLRLGYDFNDALLRMLALDMEAFYLARPLLSAIFIVLAASGLVGLFREPLQSITRLLFRPLIGGKHPVASSTSPSFVPQSGLGMMVRRRLPYVILVASVLLGIVVTTYPYTVAKVDRILGSDAWWYLQELGLIHTLADIPPRLQADRGFFLLLLFMIRSVTGLDAQSLVEWTPALLSALLAVSSFIFVREGTGRLWLAAFAALLSAVSAQTSLGMGAFILTNWFALSVANFMFALVVRAIRCRSTLSAVGALVVSLVLLGSYAFLWVVTIAELAVVLLASVLAFRNVEARDWKREVESLGGVLVGSILLPIAFVFLVVMPLLGFKPQGLDVSVWLMMGWNYLAHGTTPQVLGSALGALEETFISPETEPTYPS